MIVCRTCEYQMSNDPKRNSMNPLVPLLSKHHDNCFARVYADAAASVAAAGSGESSNRKKNLLMVYYDHPFFPNKKHTVLQLAVITNNVFAVEHIITKSIQKPKNRISLNEAINHKNKNDRYFTLLHYAFENMVNHRNGPVEMISILLYHGANINAISAAKDSNDGVTPMFHLLKTLAFVLDHSNDDVTKPAVSKRIFFQLKRIMDTCFANEISIFMNIRCCCYFDDDIGFSADKQKEDKNMMTIEQYWKSKIIYYYHRRNNAAASDDASISIHHYYKKQQSVYRRIISRIVSSSSSSDIITNDRGVEEQVDYTYQIYFLIKNHANYSTNHNV